MDRECYDKVINSPKCTKVTPAPSPSKDKGGESPPSPTFEPDELTELIISEPEEDQPKVS